MNFKNFEQTGMSAQEHSHFREELKENSFESRAKTLRQFARRELDRDDAFAQFISKLNAKYLKVLPTEDECTTIAESKDGSIFIHEAPMVLASILEYRSMKQG